MEDLPMSRVKFNVNTEYAYLQNFKILSNAFTKHGIERPVPVESLVKCKMQDNLEFLQWTKRYWDQYYPGGDYDAVARRKGAGASTAPPSAAPTSARTSGAGAGRRGTTPSSTAGSMAPTRARPGGGPVSSAVLSEIQQLKQTVEGLERERDFYFSKLRDIELLIQQAVEQDPEIEKDEGGLVKLIQQILYSTEVSHTMTRKQLFEEVPVADILYQEGFEIPAEAEGVADDGETF
ncbi:MAG: hypothetical protein Q9217_003832 [Psora testacea]